MTFIILQMCKAIQGNLLTSPTKLEAKIRATSRQLSTSGNKTCDLASLGPNINH